ncbi:MULTISPECIES: acetyltransferase [Acidobacterium]|uniref:Putative acetyltransferase n=1 Tax=Acidobacterium capsulatum (strain ATCC 51196 / DSM 11244 / BCRC 80197 / JCM 7670 / NBRC 15755 / NCIMB 13165 / 161) TaxID=240015 RepID=C1F8K1_ACIC5|nr:MULTISPECIES: acetyltransferase [Acidobacterium]ACO31581.1 putative acetyltransferase [Acidobacterium capsulatum ATCC 51196]HCT61501.1 putative colanic acid biosynthesis acetyltransferase [Acidobacterium sp.]
MTTDLTQPSVDPHLQASYSVSNRARRAVWNLFYALFFRTSPRPFHGWRSMILRLFGAKLAPNCHFYPKCRIWAPWNLVCEEAVGVGDDAELYNPSLLTIGSHAVVSQGAYVCGATHLYNEPSFRLVSYPMRIGAYSWVCAKAIVSPGVNVGDGAILAMASLATKDLEPFGVYAGMPARKVKDRDRAAVPALLKK